MLLLVQVHINVCDCDTSACVIFKSQRRLPVYLFDGRSVCYHYGAWNNLLHLCTLRTRRGIVIVLVCRSLCPCVHSRVFFLRLHPLTAAMHFYVLCVLTSQEVITVDNAWSNNPFVRNVTQLFMWPSVSGGGWLLSNWKTLLNKCNCLWIFRYLTIGVNTGFQHLTAA